MARAPSCHDGLCEFESRRGRSVYKVLGVNMAFWRKEKNTKKVRQQRNEVRRFKEYGVEHDSTVGEQSLPPVPRKDKR